MRFTDVISLASRTIRGNRLRTGLTVAIIAFGIMALIGIITAIKAMNQKFTESFTTMGANSFTLRFKERTLMFGNNNKEIRVSRKTDKKEKKSNLGKLITRDEAEAFVERFSFSSVKSISLFGGRNNTASYLNRKTNPNVFLFGGDEQYLLLNGFTLAFGRNMTREEVASGQNVCMLGYDVAKKLFRERPETAPNSVIRINNIPFRVLSVMKSRGSSFGFSRDNLIVTGYPNLEKNFSQGRSYVIGVMAKDILQVPAAMSEAGGIFRSVRKLKATDADNFVLDRSDSIAEKAMKSLGFLTLSATIIGFITLIGAAIGLMNIMLVSVSERTREVGLTKAIGGKKQTIIRQFLLEAIMISVLGAVFGIVLGIIVGNIFSVVLQTGFVVPWNWVLYGIIICSLVGLLAGLYPAFKAGKLSPIDALRYE